MKQPTKKQKLLWEQAREIGCIVGPTLSCEGVSEIHHCLTGAGGRKDHDKVICLCYGHHRGRDGIHTISRKIWQLKHGSEISLMVKTQDKIDEQNH